MHMKKVTQTLIILMLISLKVNAQFLDLIDDFSKTDKVKHSQLSFFAAYTDNREELINYNSQFALAPASGLKLITTAASLDVLGPDYTFETKIYYDGSIEKNVLKGNLYIKGGGDPTFGSDLTEGSLKLDSVMKLITDSIKKLGIEKVEGSIVADETLFKGIESSRSWFWEDMGNYYGAAVSALTIHDNLYYLYFMPDEIVGRKAKVLRTEPEIPNLIFNNFMKTGKPGSGDNGYVFGAPKQFNVSLRGTIPQEGEEFSIKGSIPDPAIFAAQYLAKNLEENDISVSKLPYKTSYEIDYSDKELVYSHKSPKLKEIIKIINKKSFNLYTEMILRMAAYEKYGTGSLNDGLKLIDEFFKKNEIDASALNLYDGCGLSRANTISTKLMVEMLVAMKGHKYFEDYYKSMAIAGNKKSISSFKYFGNGTAIDHNARIKSGYIKGVRSHSGYVKDKSGRMIAFSFIVNNFKGSTRNINNFHKKLMIELAKLK